MDLLTMRAGTGRCNDLLAGVMVSDTDECILWPFSLDKDGYAGRVQSHNVKRKAYLVACEHANGPRPGGMQAAHSCGQRSCVNPQHLRWATPLENNREKERHGTVNHGERQGHHKLSEEDVITIRRAVAGGRMSKDVAAEYGVVPSNVTQIVQRKTWRHVA